MGLVPDKIDGVPTLQVVPTDGSAPLDVLETGGSVIFPSFLPPNGEEIVYRAVVDTSSGKRSGLFAISPAGGEPRPLTPTDGDPEFSYNSPMPSPDGRHVVYDFWDPVAERMRLRLLDVASGSAVEVGPTDAPFGEGSGMFSPDGKLLAFRGYGDSHSFQLYVVPADGGEAPRALSGDMPNEAWHEFSPDGTKVMINKFHVGTVLVDVATGSAEALPDTVTEPGTWQRLAP